MWQKCGPYDTNKDLSQPKTHKPTKKSRKKKTLPNFKLTLCFKKKKYITLTAQIKPIFVTVYFHTFIQITCFFVFFVFNLLCFYFIFSVGNMSHPFFWVFVCDNISPAINRHTHLNSQIKGLFTKKK